MELRRSSLRGSPPTRTAWCTSAWRRPDACSPRFRHDAGRRPSSVCSRSKPSSAHLAWRLRRSGEDDLGCRAGGRSVWRAFHHVGVWRGLVARPTKLLCRSVVSVLVLVAAKVSNRHPASGPWPSTCSARSTTSALRRRGRCKERSWRSGSSLWCLSPYVSLVLVELGMHAAGERARGQLHDASSHPLLVPRQI
jgi:hypothetical protein